MPKIVLNLNQPILDLSDDADAKDGLKATGDSKNNLGRTLATLLKVAQEGDALKHLDWAIELHRAGRIEVDESDYKYLLTFVENSKNLWALVKGQLLRALHEAKDARPAKA